MAIETNPVQGDSIILVGVLNKIGSTNIPMGISFMKHGFHITPVNYRDIIEKYGQQAFYNYMIHLIEKIKPRLIIFAKCNGVNPTVTKECSKYTRTWLWNPDPVQTIQMCPEVLEHAKNCTYASCTGGGTAAWFQQQGVENCFHILDGLDHTVFKPVKPAKKYKADISFIGTRTPERDNYKEVLEQAGYVVKFYGNGYGGEVVNSEFAKVCASSTYMLSINTYNDIPHYFSNRLLRYLGCGSCTFHLDPTETIGTFFNVDEELIAFKTPEELVEKLNGMTNKEAGRIAMNGREAVLHKYLWDNTIQNMVYAINTTDIKQ